MMKNRRSIISYMLMHIIFWCGYVVTWSYTAVYLEDCGYNNVVVGLVTGIGAAVSVVMQPVLAAMIGRFAWMNTRTNIILLKGVSVIIAGVILMKPGGMYTVALLFLILAAIDASVPSMLSTLAMESVNAGTYINYGLARGSGSIMYALFSLFLGYAVVWFEPSSLMVFYIVLSMGTVLVSFLFPQTKTEEKETETAVSRTSHSGLFRKYPFLLCFLIASVTLFMGHNMINMFMVRLIERAGGSSENLGLALAIGAAVELPVMGLFVKLSKRFRIDKMLVFSAVFFTLKCILSLLAVRLWMIYLVQFLQFGAFALFTPASVYFMNQAMDEEDSAVGQALLGSCSLGLGGALGNVLGGFAMERAGVSGMLICSILLAVIGLISMLGCSKQYTHMHAKDAVL